MRTAVAGVTGLVVAAALMVGCGGSSSSSKTASSGSSSKVTVGTVPKTKGKVKVIAPGTDPCLLLTEAMAKDLLGGEVRKQTDTHPSPSANYCDYLTTTAPVSRVELGIRRSPTTRTDYDKSIGLAKANRPAGLCEVVPNLADVATYCAGYADNQSATSSFIAVLDGEADLTGGVSLFDANDNELPASKDKSIEMMRRILTP